MKSKLTREYILPKRIVMEKFTENKEVLLVNDTVQAMVDAKNFCTIKKNGYIILDFGKELQGGLNITVHLTGEEESGKLRIVFGESIAEALSDVGIKGATNDHSMRDFVVEVPTRSNFDCGKTGFRFCRLEVLNSEIQLISTQAVFVYRDIAYKGSFVCDNERLNEIWKTGAYTVHLNMQDYLWDGIKRDRLVWVGDMHPETSVISAVFGYDETVPKSLDLIREETPVTQWMDGIPAYSMWWLKIHRDWYMQNGNLAYLREQEEYIAALLEKLFAVIREDGTNCIEYKFVDWSSYQTDSADAGVHAMLMIAMKAGEELCTFLGRLELAGKCREKQAILKRIHPFYDNKQVAGLLAYSGANRDSEIMEYIRTNPLQGLSTFMGFYVLYAYYLAGDMDGAFRVIENYWGAMLDLGATTFWEDFDLAWAENACGIDEVPSEGKQDVHGEHGKFCYCGFRHSLCHGWAGGPTAFLSRCVLGIEILEPGCKTVRITPHLGKLNFARGTYPTPYGLIAVEHTRINGKIETKVNAPKEITVLK